MAGAVDLPSSSGRRSLNAEVNLVPFIDLLSVCICFLLMTAVWVQLGMLEVQQTQGTVGSASNDSFELDFSFVAPNSAKITLKRKGKNIQAVTAKGADEKEFLAQVEQNVSVLAKKANAPIGSAILTPRQDVLYGSMIQVMDVLRSFKIVNLGVVPVGKGSGS